MIFSRKEPEPSDGAQAPSTGRRSPTDRPLDQDAAWLEDAALAEQSRADPEAFGALYDRYADRIYRFVYRRLPDRESAEDVTAEVFFKALRAIGAYRPETAPFSAWLYRIAANAVTDYLRARRVTSDIDAVPETPDRAAPVEQQVVNRVEADRVWTVVDKLTEAQRTAVILRLGHDLPIAEIAARMNRSEGAVKLLLNRGLTAVRAHFGVTQGPGGGQSRGAPGKGSG